MQLIKSRQIESLVADKIIETNDRKFVTEEQILRWDTGAGSSGTPGQDGKNIELIKNDTHIMWRVEGESEWHELVALSDITGAVGPAGQDGLPGRDGKNIELKTDNTHVLWKLEGDLDWNELISLANISGTDGQDGLDGQDGRSVELIKTSSHIMWRHTGQEDGVGWTPLIALSEITGPTGASGKDGAAGIDGKNIELSKTATHIVWRVEGETTWKDLIALSDITGPAGADGGSASLPNEDTLKKISEDAQGNLLFDGSKIQADIDTSKLATKEELKNINTLAEHSNRYVLDLLSTDGTDLFFNGKNVNNINLSNSENYSHSITILNTTANNTHQISLNNESQCDLIIQAWEFEEGQQDVVSIIKNFNNADKNNFYYNKDNISFDDKCKIKDSYELKSELNSEGFHETVFNKNDFIELFKLRGEING